MTAGIFQLCEEVIEFVQCDQRACLLVGVVNALTSGTNSPNPLLHKFITLMNSLLRYCLRKFFNAPRLKNESKPQSFVQIVPRTGSFLYNFDDVAAIARSSIETLHELKPVVEDVVLFGKDESSLGTARDIRHCFGSFIGKVLQ